MIDLANETLLSFGEAAKRIPSFRKGRPTHTSTLYRWASEGSRGVRLETVRANGRLATTAEALERFAERLAGGGSRANAVPAIIPIRSTVSRRADRNPTNPTR